MEDDGNVEASSADVDYMNVIITGDFYPVYQSDEVLWDIGFFFRDQGSNDELRLKFDSSGEYYILNRIGEDENHLVDGTINSLNLSVNTPNTVTLMVWEDQCVLFVNNQFITEVDISVRMMSGNVSIVTNIDDENYLPVLKPVMKISPSTRFRCNRTADDQDKAQEIDCTLFFNQIKSL